MTDPRTRAFAQQQQAITATAPLFIRACPGAGKTHVVVSRHLRTVSPALRHGRALLSFTRAAAQQMRQRCHREARPEATIFPHYIGTLDAFIWDILVAPYQKPGRQWRLLDSWNPVTATVQLDRSVPLAAFTFMYDPATKQESIRRDLLSADIDRLIKASRYSWSDWRSKAVAIRDEQYKQGYLTGHESRILALRNLDRGDTFVGPLRSRFAEIVVDEAQDCSVADLAVLSGLSQHGIPLVVVADPDQMIYSWRDADLDQLHILEKSLEQTITLDGNWRSTSVVCRLAATIRSGTRPPDTAVCAQTPEPPVLLLPTIFSKQKPAQHTLSGRPIIDVFLDHAAIHTVDVAGCLVTAELRDSLPMPSRGTGGNQATMLARAWRIIRSGSAHPGHLDEALKVTAQLLMRYWYPDTTGTVEARCAHAGITHAQVMRHAYAFLHALPEPHSGWPAQVNEQLKTWPRPAGARPRGATGQLRAKPKAGLTKALAHTYRVDNIHQVKGDEYDGVLVLLPNPDLDHVWRHHDPAHNETMRSWYVAVTRARRLIALAVPDDQVEPLSHHLSSGDVPILIG